MLKLSHGNAGQSRMFRQKRGTRQFFTSRAAARADARCREPERLGARTQPRPAPLSPFNPEAYPHGSRRKLPTSDGRTAGRTADGDRGGALRGLRTGRRSQSQPSSVVGDDAHSAAFAGLYGALSTNSP